MKIKLLFLATLLIALQESNFAANLSPDKTLWYKTPGKDWVSQALHIGNGFMGASFYGGVEKECFNIAEETFWTGGPNSVSSYNYGIKEGGKEHIGLIRQAIAGNRIHTADSLAEKYMKGDYEGYGFFSKVGELYLESDHTFNDISDYVRGVDLSNSLGFVEYKKGDVHFQREYFCSYPDKAMVIHLSADKKGKINFSTYQDSFYKVTATEWLPGNEWVIHGIITESGLEYCVRIKVQTQGGQVSYKDGKITVAKANEATIFYAVATEYDATKPNFKGVDPKTETAENIRSASSRPYPAVRAKHISDYKTLFDRVSLTLKGDIQIESLPTDKRVEQLQKGSTDDASLKALLFNYGRYLLISASRPGTLPSTLQGVWNNTKIAAWSGNFQSNINLQEMYWGAGPTQLAECQQAYVDWVQGLVESGRKVAQAYYGTNGWVSHATGNIWKYAAPGIDMKWGLYPSGSAWHCRHLWEQYEYTANKRYLQETAYPIMKEAARFYLENLMEYDGHLVMTPAVSAEHGIETKDGVPVEYSTLNGETDANKLYLYPGFQDVEMVCDLFNNVLSASKILNVDADFRKEVQTAHDNLMPLKIGKYGQLQEWVIDVDNPRDHHRHIAHLYGVYPGETVTPFGTPELAAAAKKSLEMRGEGFIRDRWFFTGGNWSMVWRVGCWARLWEGDRAMHVFNLMFRETGRANLHTTQVDKMQVDASMSVPGIFSEMLMQSHGGMIHLLPALPTEWPEGEVEGLQARGGYIIRMNWKYGRLIQAEIAVPAGMPVPELRLAKERISQKDSRIVIKKQNK